MKQGKSANNIAYFTSEYANGSSGTTKTVNWNNGNKLVL